MSNERLIIPLVVISVDGVILISSYYAITMKFSLGTTALPITSTSNNINDFKHTHTNDFKHQRLQTT